MIGSTISHYKIIEELGQGGMGVVYKAEDTRLKRTVALKFLPPELTRDPEAKERFIREAQAASALQHSNICNIHDIDETSDGNMFIVMDCYDGESLKEKIRQGPLTLENLLEITVQVASGLAKAHEKGIIHCDIKPANIFITREGTVKILDFGLAKLAGHDSRSQVETTLGTVAYMSPEQARGEEVDQRTDIWSVGVVLFEMITRQKPFKSEYEQALIYAILNEEPPAPSALRPDIPPLLEKTIQRALQKERDKRYQQVEEIISDLKSLRQDKSDSNEITRKTSKWPWIGAGVLLILILICIYLFYPRSAPPAPNQKSIAVLPFKNLSDSKEDEYFSDGVTDDIIAQLSKIADLKVISRTSVMQYKGVNKNIREIGKELDVGTVLEGSVRHAGNQLRIVAQLIDARNEGHLWADTYDKEMTQIFAVQSDVAQKIAAALQSKLSSGEKERIEKKQTENTEAYELYLKGRFYWNKRRLDDVKTAIVYFKQAIEKDPGYALAYAGLASAYVLIPSYGILSEEWFANAQRTALKALEIDSSLAEAYTVLGEIAQDRNYDWAGTEEYFRRAIDLDPNYPTAHQWYSSTLLYLGKFDEALAESKQAQSLDPLSLIINTSLGEVLYMIRQYDEAIEQYQNTLALDQNFPWTHLDLALVYEMQGRFDEAIAECKIAENLAGRIPLMLSYTGRAYAMAGRKQDALKVLDDLLRLTQQGYAASLGIAFIYYKLGDKEKTFEWLEKACQLRETELLYISVDPFWDDLRQEPRFIALLKKMGLKK